MTLQELIEALQALPKSALTATVRSPYTLPLRPDYQHGEVTLYGAEQDERVQNALNRYQG